MPEPTLRLTILALKVLKALLERKSEPYQAELAEAAGVSQASLSRTLRVLEKRGWVASRQEDVDESKAGRPARLYYSLTPTGKVYTEDALQGVALKGPLDAVDVGQWWSDLPMLNEQGPIYDTTYTVTGVEREAACDHVWNGLEYLRSDGYEVWTRNEVSIRLRTNTLSTVKLFLKEAGEFETAYHDARIESYNVEEE